MIRILFSFKLMIIILKFHQNDCDPTFLITFELKDLEIIFDSGLYSFNQD